MHAYVSMFRSRSSAIFLIVLALTAAAIVIAATSPKRAADRAQFFRTALSATGTTTIERFGTTYTVVNGAVYQDGVEIAPVNAVPLLALAYAKIAAARHPIMAIPGEDTTALRTSIERLEESQRVLSRVQADAKSRAAIRDLFPTDFLRALADLEDARRAFVARGSDTAERVYERAQMQALRAYGSDMTAFRSSFNTVVSGDTPAYATVDAFVTKQAIDGALARLSLATASAHQRALDRDRCVAGEVEGCRSDDLAYPSIATVESVPLDSALKAQISRVRSMLSRGAEAPELIAARGVMLPDSACASHMAAPVFAMFPYTVLGEPVPTPIPIGDVIFLSTAADHSPYLAYYADHGIRYYWSSPDSHYKCLLLQSDVARITASLSVAELASKNPLSSLINSAESRAELRSLEQRLSRDVIQEADAIEYMTIAGRVREQLPENLQNAVLEQTLQFAYQTGGLEIVVRKIAAVETSNALLSAAGLPTDVRASRLFASDSGFLPLFLGDNLTLMTSSQPLMPQNTLSRSSEPYLYLNDLGVVSDNELIRDIRFEHDLTATQM